MTTFLKALAAILAIAFPLILAAASFGFSMPAAFDATNTFLAFVAVLTLLTLGADYREARPLVARGGVSVTTTYRSVWQLAA